MNAAKISSGMSASGIGLIKADLMIAYHSDQDRTPSYFHGR